MIKNSKLKLAELVIPLVLACFSGGLAAKGEFENEVLARIEAAQHSKKMELGQQRVYGNVFVTKIYESNGYKPIWNEASLQTLKSEIEDVRGDGLDPSDYWFSSIDTLVKMKQKGPLDASSAVDLDILLTEAFTRAYYNLLVGKIDPEQLDSNFNFPKPFEREKLRPELISQVIKGNVSGAFKQARPENNTYHQLMEALKKYRKYEEAGGWPLITQGETLKPGNESPRVAQLRARLLVSGDYLAGGYTGGPGESEHYDPALEAAVKRFQARHGLEVDGVVGARSLAAMNISVRQRIDQLRVNLERLRWYLHEIYGEFVLVDIARFQAYWFKGDQIFWESRTQVGKYYTQTPVFKDLIRYLEFNPTWTIPPGILRRSILPNLKKDPEYLDKKGYLLLTQDGTQVDPESVDWGSINTMPYMVRQPAGPNNALGLIKFMFPNKHAVYLHDTTNKVQFSAASRSFSAGCVRVEKPFDFAEKLLRGQGDWDRQKIDAVVASGETTRVNLDKPIRVIIAYRTALVRDDQVHFKEDVYKRDARILQYLDAPFKMRAVDN